MPSVTYVPFNGTAQWEYSANWVGIGGYCETASCNSVDNTLIQLGTGQSALDSGDAYYYAWYELLPKYAVTIPKSRQSRHYHDRLVAMHNGMRGRHNPNLGSQHVRRDSRIGLGARRSNIKPVWDRLSGLSRRPPPAALFRSLITCKPISSRCRPTA